MCLDFRGCLTDAFSVVIQLVMARRPEAWETDVPVTADSDRLLYVTDPITFQKFTTELTTNLKINLITVEKSTDCKSTIHRTSRRIRYKIALGTLRHQDTSALNYSAKCPDTSAPICMWHFGTTVYLYRPYNNAFHSVCCTLTLNMKTNTCHQNIIIHVVCCIMCIYVKLLGKK